MADEASFIDLVIASERIGTWIDVIRQPPSRSRMVSAVQELEKAVTTNEAYAEEALTAGAIAVLTKQLKHELAEGTPESEGSLMDSISNIISTCSGEDGAYGKISCFDYGDVSVMIREGALGQGVGAKMWEVAHILNRFIYDHRDTVVGKNVLEIGSGCGSTGILAAKLGATKVVLSDCVPEVLYNLRSCMLMNSNPPEDETGEIDDLSEVSTVSDMNLGELTLDDNWGVDNMSVRYLDWTESLPDRLLSGESQHEPLPAGSHAHELPGDGGPARLDPGESFEIILGTDVIYEEEHAALVAAVLQDRLARYGKCLIAGAVREQKFYSNFLRLCANYGLRCQCHSPNVPKTERHREYEGGFVIIALDWAHYPGWPSTIPGFEPHLASHESIGNSPACAQRSEI